MIGQKFNRLTIIKEEEKIKYEKCTVRRFLCRCECGNEKIIIWQHLKSGKIKSCGCLNNEVRSKRIVEYSTKHGLYHHPLYKLYQNMKHRCYNENNTKWEHYGGRGIKVCDRWLGEDGVVNFINDMGERPIGHTLDRINNDGDYEPSNCKWSTYKEQNKNRRPFIGKNQYSK